VKERAKFLMFLDFYRGSMRRYDYKYFKEAVLVVEGFWEPQVCSLIPVKIQNIKWRW
jgi:hypothetical protein